MTLKVNQTGFRTMWAALGVALVLSASPARADVKLPGLISEGMVLQQKAPVRLWGWADDGETVTVKFQGQKVATSARGGKWAVMLAPLRAGGPFTLSIAGKNAIEFRNVLVGEVWVCSGQSNMEWALRNSFEPEQHIAKAENPRIRLFVVPRVRTAAPREDVAATWQACTPETVPGFSAVGYFFGRDLQRDLGVPIGLIQSAWGGTPAEAWADEWAILSHPVLSPLLERHRTAQANYRNVIAAFPAQVAQARAEGKPAPRAPSQPWKPGELYNGMIAPLTPYTIRGAIWYQGESNAGRAEQYRTLFPEMIQSWRRAFGQRDFPFLAVQLAPFGPGNNYAELREAQLVTTKVLPNVGMAVITDVGEENDIHPKKKEPVGQRLALAARKIAYGQNVAHSGPLYRSMRFEGSRVILQFDQVGQGLEARGGSLAGFTIAGADGNFVPAEARIEGDTVVVTAQSVPKPVAVRYGWANYPVVNLWNKDGLPASPFRTDAPPVK